MKIVIIKLGALGDVIRTLPLAIALKKKFPDSRIDWITKKNIVEIVKRCDSVSNVFPLPFKTNEKYDLLYNFDIEKEACELAIKINAKEKKGFYFSDGYPAAFNFGAEYYLSTLFDDELKKKNKKTYQEIMFETAELEYKKEKFNLSLSKEEVEFGNSFVSKNSLRKGKIIGIHIGSSPRWPSKAWHNEKIEEFIVKAKEKGYDVILFAGPDDIKRQEQISKFLEEKNIMFAKNNPNNTLLEFFSLINVCNFVVCSDSMALHASLSLNKKTIALFFCTTSDEIEGYGLLKKLVSKKLYEFFPERMNEYNEELVKSISTEEVLDAVLN